MENKSKLVFLKTEIYYGLLRCKPLLFVEFKTKLGTLYLIIPCYIFSTIQWLTKTQLLILHNNFSVYVHLIES